MSDIDVKPDTIAKPKIEQPRLYKVILINDDYTPREFVIAVLMAVFHMSEDQAYRVMMTAHQRGACAVAAFTRHLPATKATAGTDVAAKHAGAVLALQRLHVTRLVEHGDRERLDLHLARLGERGLDDLVGLGKGELGHEFLHGATLVVRYLKVS